jgi:hypothetical protein
MCCDCYWCVYWYLFPGGSGVVLLLRAGVVADFLPAATVGSISAVFISWDVGLVYK